MGAVEAENLETDLADGGGGYKSRLRLGNGWEAGTFFADVLFIVHM